MPKQTRVASKKKPAKEVCQDDKRLAQPLTDRDRHIMLKSENCALSGVGQV